MKPLKIRLAGENRNPLPIQLDFAHLITTNKIMTTSAERIGGNKPGFMTRGPKISEKSKRPASHPSFLPAVSA
jgi:hypothetical protein